MNMLLILLTLIAIFLIDGTLGKAFDSQSNNKDIFQKDSRGMQRVKEMLWSDQANFYMNPLKSETNDSSTFEQFSVSVPNDAPAFMQLCVPNDITAITTSSFKQLNVPMIATLIDLSTCNNSLSFYFDTITATLTAKSTHVSATLTAQMNSSVLNPATHATSLFLLRVKDNSEIMTPSLLLPFNQNNSAIMTATHASLLLPFNQDNPAITTVPHAQNLLLYAQTGSAITTSTHAQNLLLLSVQDDPAIMMATQAKYSLQLIVESLFLLCNEDNSETTAPSLLLFCVKDDPAIMMAPLTNFSLQLIVVIFCKISFHFCED
jgi:hypothetical protein